MDKLNFETVSWIYSPDDPLWETLIGVLILLSAVILLTRAVGLRSFAKFTAFDFAFTVAIGSVVASTLTSSTSLVHGILTIAGLLLATYFTSVLQKKFGAFRKITSNSPLLLMRDGEILDENLKKAQVSTDQLKAKLREANVLNYGQVRAVVLESTGDISVLHCEDESVQFEDSLLEGVRKQ